MSDTKQKILNALDCALGDLSEGRLLDILLDAYQAKKNEIGRLESEIRKLGYDPGTGYALNRVAKIGDSK